jgi:hypothetical protein
LVSKQNHFTFIVKKNWKVIPAIIIFKRGVFHDLLVTGSVVCNNKPLIILFIKDTITVNKEITAKAFSIF